MDIDIAIARVARNDRATKKIAIANEQERMRLERDELLVQKAAREGNLKAQILLSDRHFDGPEADEIDAFGWTKIVLKPKSGIVKLPTKGMGGR